MKKQLSKKICSIIFFICVIFSVTSNAQIVYTDVKPDISLKCDKPNCSKTYSLDVNNDGTPDFNITVHISATTPERGIYVTPLNGDSIVVIPPPFYYSGQNYPSALVEGSIIGPALTWRNSANPYNNPPYMYLRGYSFVCHYDIELGCGYYYDYVGRWSEKSDRYLGLKFISNGQTYYGWARLSVSVTATKWATSCKIKDYAFESTPNVAIIAGNTGTSPVTKSSIDNAEKEKTAEPGELKIAPNPVSTKSIISFSLAHSEKVSLKVFDANGRLISTIADREFVAGNNQVEWSATNIAAGLYFLRMQTLSYSMNKKLIVAK